MEDEEEETAINYFVTKTCCCLLGKGNTACPRTLSRSAILEMRRNYQQLTRHELDLVIMAQVNALQLKKTSENSRNRITYFFQCERICRTMFNFLHGIQKECFRALCKKVSEDGISTRIHGNTKRVQSNAFDFADRERAVNFVKNAVEVHAFLYQEDYPTIKIKPYYCHQICPRFMFTVSTKRAVHPWEYHQWVGAHLPIVEGHSAQHCNDETFF